MEFRKKTGYWYQNKEVYEMRFNETSKWYSINRKNIVFKGALKLQAQLINAAIQGLVCHVKGSYSRRAKKLTLNLEGGD